MATTVPNPFDTQNPTPPGVTPLPYVEPPTEPTLPVPDPVPTPTPIIAPAPAVATVDPTMVNMTSDQTVEGRSAGIIAKNSPLMQLAETRANQQANARGLINSSMAVGAGQTAVLDRATDIAKSDAATAAHTAQINANAANTAKSLNAAATNQFGMVDKTMQADIAKMGVQQQNDLAMLAKRQGYTLDTMSAEQVNDLAKMTKQIEAQDKQALDKFGYDKQLVEIQRASNREIAGLEAQYKNLTQASASATAIINSVSSNVARIMENTTLDAAAKQLAIDTYSANANKALQMIGAISGDVDLVSFFDEVLNGVVPESEPPMGDSGPDFGGGGYGGDGGGGGGQG